MRMPIFSDLTFKLASGAQREDAIRLRQRVYEQELGYHGVDKFDEQAHQLIAVDSSGEIVAATRILGPDQRPLEIEQFITLGALAPEDRRVAQIGGFWIRAADRRVQSSAFLPLGMLKLAFSFAQKRGITDFVMRTHITALKRFYERGFFRLVEELAFNHPKWGPVYVMHLDLLSLASSHQQSNDPIARFLLSDLSMSGQIQL